MSKLTFRAKALEHNRKMPVYIGDEIPELTDFAIVNRTVPEMPTGMEKEEETQHHLQKALSAQQTCGSISNLIIPIPELREAKHYDRIYATRVGFCVSKKLIHVQPSSVDQELPDYDMDTEDELWLNNHKSIFDDLGSDTVRFENMVDKLEKGSGQIVVKLNEAKALIKEKDDIVTAVYDYWLGKRLQQQRKVKELLALKAENLCAQAGLSSGPSTSNPYLAFRKRAERMQTRKNRKNDEQSYLGILQLKKSFEKARTLMELLKMRESWKLDLIEMKRSILRKRHEIQDWTGDCVREVEKSIRPVHLPDWSHMFAHSTLDSQRLTQSVRSTSMPSPTQPSTGRLYGERSRKRKKKHDHRRRYQMKSGWQDGSDAASVEEEEDDNDVEYKVKNLHADDRDDREEVERLSKLLSFFKPLIPSTIPSSWDDLASEGTHCKIHSDDSEDDTLLDGKYTFKRKEGCYYQAPISFESLANDCDAPPYANQVFAPDMYRAGRGFSLTTLVSPPMTGYMRQRMGRGGRVIIDRIPHSDCPVLDDCSHDVVSQLHSRKRPLFSKNQHSFKKEYNRLPSHSEGSSSRPFEPPDIRYSATSASVKEVNLKDATHHHRAQHKRTLDCGKENPDTSGDSSSIKNEYSSSSAALEYDRPSSSTSSQETKTCTRTSRASFLTSFPSVTSGYKRKCSNRTDSEDSGVCSPSPSPPVGSSPLSKPVATLNVNPEHLKRSKGSLTSKLPDVRAKNVRSSTSVDMDDGICDDHSNNGDSCGSFSDHRAKVTEVNGPDFIESMLGGERVVSSGVDHKRIKLDQPANGTLARRHLSSFDSGKFSLLASKMMMKEGSIKVNLAQASNENHVRGNGMRFQYQMRLPDANNLSNLNSEVATALQVS